MNIVVRVSREIMLEQHALLSHPYLTVKIMWRNNKDSCTLMYFTSFFTDEEPILIRKLNIEKLPHTQKRGGVYGKENQ